MGNYWTDRALPVLRALEAPSDDRVRDGFLSIGRGRAEKNLGVELSDDATHDTILQLDDAGYVEFKNVSYESGGGAHFAGLHITGAGYRCLDNGLASRRSSRHSRSPLCSTRWPSMPLPTRQPR
jgi:hypothetical protein